MMMKASAHGVAWYKREDYPRLMEMFLDSATFPATYEEWLPLAEKAWSTIQKTGARPVKVIIEPDAFARWCALHDQPLNSKGRLAYGNSIAMKDLHRWN